MDIDRLKFRHIKRFFLPKEEQLNESNGYTPQPRGRRRRLCGSFTHTKPDGCRRRHSGTPRECLIVISQEPTTPRPIIAKSNRGVALGNDQSRHVTIQLASPLCWIAPGY